jgi:hypothetical protein
MSHLVYWYQSTVWKFVLKFVFYEKINSSVIVYVGS